VNGFQRTIKAQFSGTRLNLDALRNLVDETKDVTGDATVDVKVDAGHPMEHGAGSTTITVTWTQS
jgi:uncharacterized protein YbjQ (UPF0145 family)